VQSMRRDSPGKRKAGVSGGIGEAILDTLLHPSTARTFEERKVVAITCRQRERDT
jgi:hypothetical protein